MPAKRTRNGARIGNTSVPTRIRTEKAGDCDRRSQHKCFLKIRIAAIINKRGAVPGRMNARMGTIVSKNPARPDLVLPEANNAEEAACWLLVYARRNSNTETPVRSMTSRIKSKLTEIIRIVFFLSRILILLMLNKKRIRTKSNNWAEKIYAVSFAVKFSASEIVSINKCLTFLVSK